MKDENKTKEQLIAELEELRQRFAKLEASESKFKLAEEMLKEALRDSQILFETTFKSLHDAVFIIDTDTTKIMECNPAASKIFGYDRQDMLGRTTAFLHVDETSLGEFRTQLYSAVKDKEFLFLSDFRMKRKDGTIFPTEHSVVPLEDDRGNRIGWVSVVRDITEKKQVGEEKRKLQAQLIHSEKMAGLGTFASGIAHEFNNLLQIMRGHTEYAQITEKPEEMRDALNIVLSTTEKATKIIRDLLVFSSSDEPEKEMCNIKEPLEAVLSLTEGQLRKNEIRVKREYGKVSRLEVNKGEMQQVFLNMITNARDAMLPRGGKLEISVKQENNQVKVSFHDTGKGIKEEELGKVLEPFFTTKESVGGSGDIFGTGLGLSVSYGILKRHSGTIEVESEVGRGTTFTVILPVKGTGVKRIVKERKKKIKKTEL